MTDLEIVASYNSELRGICNYYNLASNFCGLSYLAYLIRCYFANYADCKTAKNPTDVITLATQQYRFSVNTIEKRLKAHTCELCGSTDSEHYEVHHINKLKNLKGKRPWEIAIIAKRLVCRGCHKMIHSQQVSD